MSNPSPSPLRWMLGLWLATVATLGLFFFWSEARQAERFSAEMARLRAELQDAKAGARPPESPAGVSAVCQVPAESADAATVERIANRVVALMEARHPAEGPRHDGGDAPAAVEANPTRTPEQRAALERAEQILDSAISRGRLLREDILEIRRQLAQAGSAQKEAMELTRRISVALNTNRLVPEDPRFVLP